MQKKNSTRKRTPRKPTAKRKEPHEIAASRLEQRKEVARQRVAQAVAEILNNPQTPAPLFDKVADFIVEGCAGTIKDLWTPAALEHLIIFVQGKEARDATN